MSFGLIPSFSANSFTVDPSIRRTDFNSPAEGTSKRVAMRSSSDNAFGGGMNSPLSNLPVLPSIFLPPRGLLRRERRRPAPGGGMLVVCGVAVSPGVPFRSLRGNDGRSRKRLLRSPGRSRAGGGGGGGGAGARSPGLIPALSAAAVGRMTLTWRDGGGSDGAAGTGAGVLTSTPFVGGALASTGAAGTGSWTTRSEEHT